MATPKVKTEIRQDQIVKTALILLAEQGNRGVTIARIAACLGIVPSAIYRHYKNKEQIYEAMIDFIGSQLRQNIHGALESGSNPIERLHGILKRHIQFIRDNQAVPRVIFSGDLYKHNSRHRERLYREIKSYLDALADLIKQGRKHNLIQQSVDPDAAALLFLGIIQPAAILWNLCDGDFDIAKLSEKVWNLYRSIIEG